MASERVLVPADLLGSLFAAHKVYCLKDMARLFRERFAEGIPPSDYDLQDIRNQAWTAACAQRLLWKARGKRVPKRTRYLDYMGRGMWPAFEGLITCERCGGKWGDENHTHGRSENGPVNLCMARRPHRNPDNDQGPGGPSFEPRKPDKRRPAHLAKEGGSG